MTYTVSSGTLNRSIPYLCPTSNCDDCECGLRLKPANPGSPRKVAIKMERERERERERSDVHPASQPTVSKH